MLILPVGQENSTVRRYPLVSWTLAAFNILLFLVLLAVSPGDEWGRRVRAKRIEVFTYLRTHPYLEVPSSLAVFCDDTCIQRMRDRYQDAGGRTPAEKVRQEEQHRLRALAAELRSLQREDPSFRLGFVPAEPDVLTLLTSMFVHGGWLHLVGNMLFFLLSGPFVEDVFGRPLFAAVYLVSGLAAAAAHAAQFPQSMVPCIGASGAISGVMGAFLVRWASRRIRMMVIPIFLIPWLRFSFYIPAFVVLPLWFADQLLSAAKEPNAGIAWWAHIGGFAFGAAIALVVRITGIEARYIHPAIEKRIGLFQHPALQRANEARLARHWERARREVRAALADDPQNMDALREWYEIETDARAPRQAAECAARLLEVYLHHDEPELAEELALDAAARVGGALSPAFFAKAASVVERRGDLSRAIDLYDRLIASHPQDAGAFRALFRQGELRRRMGDALGARQAFERARAHSGCSDLMRQAVDQALSELRQPRRAV